MIHLFYLHSYITYIVADGIIEHENLKKENVVFLVHRGFEPPTNEIKSYDNPYDKPEKEIKSHKNILKSLRKLGSFNRYIQQITDDQPFKAYVPTTKTKLIQLIINHSKCRAFSIIEHGTTAYMTPERIQKAYTTNSSSIFNKVGYLGKIKDNKYYDDRYEYVYGLFEQSFPGYPRRVILDEQFNKLEIKGKDTYGYLDNSAIIVLDGSSIYNYLRQGVHVFTILKILNFIRDNEIEDVYFKLHPAQLHTVEERLFRRIFDEYNSEVNIKKLGDDFSLEEIIMGAQNLAFFIDISSVGLYALMYDHKVYSTLKISTELDDKYKEYVKHFPDYFKDRLKYIE